MRNLLLWLMGCTCTLVQGESVLAPTTPPDGMCLQNGQLYPEGTKIPSDDPCKHCDCHEGRVICAVMDCAPVTCVDPVKDKNSCCPRCPNGSNCWYGNKVVSAGKEEYDRKKKISCKCSEPWDPLAKCTKIPTKKYKKLIRDFGSWLGITRIAK